ncbi:MAG: geranylgeranyl reductase family protein [Anaerolineae bacterium]|nr:geranylgeranyl reductase family protein [Anaerolineae bacterium]
MDTIYDVIVVGGGPAGATAAYFLGKAGRRVLVIEKATQPRYKACGGGLSLSFLESQFPFSFDSIIETDVEAITYVLDEHSVTIPLPTSEMRMVMRDRFDAYLLAQAQAEVWQGVAVRKVTETPGCVSVETSDGRTATGILLIGADGANSVVAQAVGLRRGKALAAAIEVEVFPEVMDRFASNPVFIFGEVRHGYLWIFPKASHLSVGIAALHPKPGELQVTLRRVMSRNAISLDGFQMHGHPIPLYTGREAITTRRVLLASDAAGLADPFSGEGIRLAITSGRLAAEAILANRPEQYEKMIFRQIGFSQWCGLGLSWLFYHFQMVCFIFGAHNPFVTRAFINLLSGRVGYPTVVIRIFATLPLFLLSEGLIQLAGLVGGPKKRRWLRTRIYPA